MTLERRANLGRFRLVNSIFVSSLNDHIDLEFVLTLTETFQKSCSTQMCSTSE